MSKKFNIHEWQANQAKKYLVEGKLFEEDFKNPILDKYLELKKSIDYKTVFPTDLQSFLDSLDNTERKGLKRDLSESLNPEVSRKVDGFIKAMADRYNYSEQDAVFAIMAALKQRNFDGVNEAEGVKHYTKDGKEWTGPTHKMPNGKLMTQDPHREDSEELFHKEDLDEMSTTGTGASFNAGSGAGYMTPNAFKKKKKK
jgi:hypothetical protein|tara:strand:+ start:1835 stop:2431 length:597 start_codon:yes stop_codon:yes gene_type:complete